MLMPDSKDTDEVLEWAAQLIEETDFSDLMGIWAKRKRDREDAQLRLDTSEHVRKRCAEHVRAFKSRPELTAVAVLKNLSELSEDTRSHVIHLRDAWPLAWKRWVRIECMVSCTDNSIPPEARYRITLTDKGREILAQSTA